MTELYQKHRPRSLKEVRGQKEAVGQLSALIRGKRIPHAFLLTGPTGCGKTTAARILQKHLQCSDMNFVEINASDMRGVETVRDIRSTMGLKALNGKTRIWLIDEAHGLTAPAQNAFLHTLENPPKHAYFMLATTDPQKLLPTIKSRCTEIRFKPFSPKDCGDLLREVSEKEQFELSEDVSDAVVNAADGSARKALVILEQVMGLADDEARLASIMKADTKTKATNLAFALLRGAKWAEVAKLLKGIDEEPERLRHMILTITGNTALGGKNVDRCQLILSAFRENYFDCGRNGLILSCLEVCSA